MGKTMTVPELLRPFWFLSFVGEGGFIGGAFLRGSSMEDVLTTSHRMKVNPVANGTPCSVQITGPIDETFAKTKLPENFRERLLTFDELKKAGMEPVVRRDMEAK